jgi:hypothetical protein
MILDFFFFIGSSILNLLALLFPNYTSLPFPTWFLPILEDIFGKIQIFILLPFVRVFADVILTWFLPLFFIYFAINTVIKYTSVIPFFNGVKNLKD